MGQTNTKSVNQPEISCMPHQEIQHISNDISGMVRPPVNDVKSRIADTTQQISNGFGDLLTLLIEQHAKLNETNEQILERVKQLEIRMNKLERQVSQNRVPQSQMTSNRSAWRYQPVMVSSIPFQTAVQQIEKKKRIYIVSLEENDILPEVMNILLARLSVLLSSNSYVIEHLRFEQIENMSYSVSNSDYFIFCNLHVDNRDPNFDLTNLFPYRWIHNRGLDINHVFLLRIRTVTDDMYTRHFRSEFLEDVKKFVNEGKTKPRMDLIGVINISGRYALSDPEKVLLSMDSHFQQ